MAVLLAYLVALVVFLGGSYEALTWLAAPEPVKIVRRVHKAEILAAESLSNSVKGGAPQAQDAASELDLAKPNSQSTTEPITTLSATADNVGEQKAPSNPLAPVTGKDHPSTKQNQNAHHQRQAHFSASPKRQLQLMTLETIEFADGRRASYLVPYHRETRTLAFSDQWRATRHDAKLASPPGRETPVYSGTFANLFY